MYRSFLEFLCCRTLCGISIVYTAPFHPAAGIASAVHLMSYHSTVLQVQMQQLPSEWDSPGQRLQPLARCSWGQADNP